MGFPRFLCLRSGGSIIRMVVYLHVICYVYGIQLVGQEAVP